MMNGITSSKKKTKRKEKIVSDRSIKHIYKGKAGKRGNNSGTKG